MNRDIRRRDLGNGRWVALALGTICLLGACAGGQEAVVDDVTSPIAPYLDKETLDTIGEEEAADALGAGELSHADRDGIAELEDIARRWATRSEPLWTSLLDPDAPYEDFVPLFEAARDGLAGTAKNFDAAVDSFDDPGLADSFRPFAESIRDQLAGFENLASAVASGDSAAVEAAAQQLNNVLTEGHKAQDAMLAGLRAYIDEEAYCASLPDGGRDLPELCGTTPSTGG